MEDDEDVPTQEEDLLSRVQVFVLPRPNEDPENADQDDIEDDVDLQMVDVSSPPSSRGASPEPLYNDESEITLTLDDGGDSDDDGDVPSPQASTKLARFAYAALSGGEPSFSALETLRYRNEESVPATPSETSVHSQRNAGMQDPFGNSDFPIEPDTPTMTASIASISSRLSTFAYSGPPHTQSTFRSSQYYVSTPEAVDCPEQHDDILVPETPPRLSFRPLPNPTSHSQQTYVPTPESPLLQPSKPLSREQSAAQSSSQPPRPLEGPDLADIFSPAKSDSSLDDIVSPDRPQDNRIAPNSRRRERSLTPTPHDKRLLLDNDDDDDEIFLDEERTREAAETKVKLFDAKWREKWSHPVSSKRKVSGLTLRYYNQSHELTTRLIVPD